MAKKMETVACAVMVIAFIGTVIFFCWPRF